MKRRIIPLLVIIFFSSYLWLVAIISTSHLDNQENTVSDESLISKIDTSLHNVFYGNEISKYTPRTDESDSLLQNTLLNIKTVIIKKRLKKIEKQFERIHYELTGELSTRKEDFNNAVNTHNEKIERFLSYNESVKSKAKEKFSNTTNSLSNKEKKAYFNHILNSYGDAISSNVVHFNKVHSSLQQAESEQVIFLALIASKMDDLLEDLTDDSIENNQLTPSVLDDLDIQKLVLPDTAAPFEADKSYAIIPNFDKNVYDWGWPGQMSSWLIKTDSYDLVLIIGMLGFGMFGAAISMFITDAVQDDSKSVFVHLVYTIIKGFSAAIIIFLSTKGGLAILTTGGAMPNPYVLFIGCFLGSVFSQPVWDWAKDYINAAYKPKSQE